MDSKVDVLNIMVCESNFYNIISAVMAKGVFIDTFIAIQIVWTQVKYHIVSSDDDAGKVPELVRIQIQEVALQQEKGLS